MSRFSIKGSLRFGWETTKHHFLFLVGLIVIAIVLSSMTSWLLSIAVNENPFLGFIAWAVNAIVSILISMGIIYITLEFCDRKTPAYKDLLTPYPLFFKYLLASILYGLVTFIGFVLLIIPGIFFAIKYGMYRYLVIDKGLGPIDALSKSGEITHGAKWKLLGFSIIVGLINIGGALLVGFGLLVTIPLTIIATAHVYRTLLQGTETVPNGGVPASTPGAPIVPSISAVE